MPVPSSNLTVLNLVLFHNKISARARPRAMSSVAIRRSGGAAAATTRTSAARQVDPRPGCCASSRAAKDWFKFELKLKTIRPSRRRSALLWTSRPSAARYSVRVVTFSFLCPLLEKDGTFIARCNALIEKVSSFRVPQ
eukprot:SAG31_NODE_19122_length_611_cov_1.724609_1_plen_138_part_00